MKLNAHILSKHFISVGFIFDCTSAASHVAHIEAVVKIGSDARIHVCHKEIPHARFWLSKLILLGGHDDLRRNTFTGELCEDAAHHATELFRESTSQSASDAALIGDDQNFVVILDQGLEFGDDTGIPPFPVLTGCGGERVGGFVKDQGAVEIDCGNLGAALGSEVCFVNQRRRVERPFICDICGHSENRVLALLGLTWREICV